MSQTWSPTGNAGTPSNSTKPGTTPPTGTTSGTDQYGWPDFTSSHYGYFPQNDLWSPDPKLRGSVWDFPTNIDLGGMNAGFSQQEPINPKTRQVVTDAVNMVGLYASFIKGSKLTHAQQQTAAQLGGDIAVAARTGKTKDINAAISEIVGSLHNTLGVDVSEFPNQIGAKNFDKLMNQKVGKQFATTLQNAGYGVSQHMTLQQMLSETGPNAPAPKTTLPSNMSVRDFVDNLGNLSKSQIWQIQQSMWNAGLYDPAYYDGSKAYTQGQLDYATVQAMRGAIEYVSAHPHTSLAQVLGGQFTTAPQGGQFGQGSPDGMTKNTTINTNNEVLQTSTTQMQNPLINAFSAALGRNPTQQELQTFTNQYNQELQNASRWASANGMNQYMDYQTGVPYVGKMPSATAAATSFAENNNPLEYQGANILSSFDRLMNMINTGKASANG